MTNREALIAELQISGYSENAVDKALLDAGLVGGGTYTPDNTKQVAIATVKVLNTMLGTKSVSEGDLSITYSIGERIAAINDEHGLLVKGRPTVTARNVW